MTAEASIKRRAELEGRPHVYLARPEKWATPEHHAALSDLLEPEERRRLERMRLPGPAGLFLTARALARLTLSRYSPVSPSAWRFTEGERGRPEIDPAYLPSGETALRFNLSRTRGLVACLVTLDADCGLDVEALARQVDALAIARHSFHPSEVAALEALPPTERRNYFFRLWTLKEAFLKAEGAGIALGLDAISLGFSGRSIEPQLAERLGESAGRARDWQLALYRPDSDHYLATALRVPRGPLDHPRFFAASPPDGCEPLELSALLTTPAPNR